MKLSIIAAAFVVVTTGNLASASPFDACSKSHQEVLINKPVLDGFDGNSHSTLFSPGIHVVSFCFVDR